MIGLEGDEEQKNGSSAEDSPSFDEAWFRGSGHASGE